jgi:hypothetical protein
MAKRKPKVFTLKVTETELFAMTESVNERLHNDPFGTLTAVEKKALHGVIRKAERSIEDHYATEWRRTHA